VAIAPDAVLGNDEIHEPVGSGDKEATRQGTYDGVQVGAESVDEQGLGVKSDRQLVRKLANIRQGYAVSILGIVRGIVCHLGRGRPVAKGEIILLQTHLHG
jgi:hypothetical protein